MFPTFDKKLYSYHHLYIKWFLQVIQFLLVESIFETPMSLKNKCKTHCTTTLITHEQDLYLLISVVVLAMYTDFDCFSTISKSKMVF